MVLSAGLVYGTFAFLERGSKAHDDAVRNFPLGVGRSQEPPAPRLQTQPFKDVYQLKNAQRGRSTATAGWTKPTASCTSRSIAPCS